MEENDINLLLDIARQASKVRSVQRLYFSTRDKSILTMSMNEERTLDHLLDKARNTIK